MKKHTTKQTDEINNPCLKEQKLVYKCLDDSNYDRDECTPHFMNYNACKEFWNKVRSDRRSNGIIPYLPLPEDRSRIKEEYFAKAAAK